jgi:hypothetical protein
MERALVLDNDAGEASRRSLTKFSWHGASKTSKYRIDVEALARQAAPPKTRPSPAPLPAELGKEQSSSTARAVEANRIQEQEHSQRAATVGADLAEALGVEFEQAQELVAKMVGPEVSEIRGGLIPGYQLERYQQIQMREVEHESEYRATDTKLQAQLHSPDRPTVAHLVTAPSDSVVVRRHHSALRVGSPARTGSSSSIPLRWPGGTSPSRTRTKPPRTYSSPGRSSPGRSSPGRDSISGRVDDQLARRLDISAGLSGPSLFTHGSLSTPRRPGTTVSGTGQLNLPTSFAATGAESMPALSSALPPRDKSSSSIRSTLRSDGITGQLERQDLGVGMSPTRRRSAVRLFASSPPRSTSSLSPGRSARRREPSLASRTNGFSPPVRSRSSAGAAEYPSSPKGRGGATLEVDPALTNMAANEHERAAMDADLRFKEALQNLEAKD